MSQVQNRCECPYNRYCHPMRQKLQISFRMESQWYKSIEQCDFYKKLKELEEKRK